MSIKRIIFDDLLNHLPKPEITVIIGPRQIGKTYLMRQMQTHAEQRHQKTMYLNLDIENHRHYLDSQSIFLDYLRLQLGTGKGIIFLDEIQRKTDAGLFLKGLYDMKLPYKFVVSGSGSLDIKAHIKESLTGRKRIFEIPPISFPEFVNFKTDYHYEKKLVEYFHLETSRTQRLLEEYMQFGGYPKVILATTTDEKKIEIEEIYRSYIEKDIAGLLHIEKSDVFSSLLRLLASQIGQLTNIRELSSTLRISQPTVKKYIWYLEATFILRRVNPFHTNLRSEISKSPLYYFTDLGLRNYLVNIFTLPQIPSVLSGHLFENTLCNHLIHPLHFWRTTDNAEVDFVINTPLFPTPIEAKYHVLTTPKLTRSYHSFLSKYHPAHGYIIHLGDTMRTKQSNTTIHFLPFWKILTDPNILVANFGK